MAFIPLERRDARIVAAEMLSPSVRGLTLEVEGDDPFTWQAGQYVTTRIDGIDDKRDYSIANAPSPGARVELAVTRVEGGPFSSAIHALPVGAKLVVDGPSGFFVREDAGDVPVLFVGTGTGLAPLRAMVQDALRSSADGPPLVLLGGFRTERDVLWRAELEALARAHPRFRYDVTLSRGEPEWKGRRGWVQVHLRELLESLPGAHAYVCGLSHMVHDVRKVLKESLGFDRKRIHSERYD